MDDKRKMVLGVRPLDTPKEKTMGDIPKLRDCIKDREKLNGDKVKIDDILGKRIIVTGFSVHRSKYDGKNGSEEYTVMQFYYADDAEKTPYVIFTGSAVVRKKLEQMEEYLDNNDLPYVFETEAKSEGKYYTLL